jgi:hypothetical protein
MSRLSKYLHWVSVYLFGATEVLEMSNDEVDMVVAGAASEQVTDELYKLGEMLLSEIQERVSGLDSKATTIIGFSGAILAFLVHQSAQPATVSTLELVGIILVALLAGTASAFAFLALKGARNWKWFSERNWFPAPEAKAGTDQLKRYYVRAMHRVERANNRIANKKADNVVKAQVLLALAAIVLALILASGATHRAVTNGPSESYSNPSPVHANADSCSNLGLDRATVSGFCPSRPQIAVAVAAAPILIDLSYRRPVRRRLDFRFPFSCLQSLSF